MPRKFKIEIFHKNLELLRQLTGYNKGEFSKLLGVANAFRNNIHSIGDKLWHGVTKYFSVPDDKEWLLAEHSEEELRLIKFTQHQMTSRSFEVEARTHEGIAEPQLLRLSSQEIDSLCNRVRKILESRHHSAVPALISNVVALDEIVKQAQEINRIREMAYQIKGRQKRGLILSIEEHLTPIPQRRKCDPCPLLNYPAKGKQS